MTHEIIGIADVNRTLQEIAPREAKNLLRATVLDIAKQLATSAKKYTPSDEGDLERGIKPKRERGSPTSVEATVRATPFYWRFLEYGQGPDGVEHAFFFNALQEMRPNMDRVYLETFVKKLEARMARERKRLAAAA
ncbi:MAG: HK97 gp10 family phage protein [Paracoccaceae bacterium]